MGRPHLHLALLFAASIAAGALSECSSSEPANPDADADSSIDTGLSADGGTQDSPFDAPADVLDSGNGKGPMEGYGLYEGCDTEFPQSCAQRLQTIAKGGFSLVLNYAVMYGTAQNVLDYFTAASNAGVRIIAAMNNPVLWNRTLPASGLPKGYQQLVTDCGGACATVGNFIDYFINLVKGEPALWGYYVGDEIDTSNAASFAIWKTYAGTIHTDDPSHPRLIVEGTQDGKLENPSIHAVAPYVEVVAQDFYPIGDSALVDAGQTGKIAAGVRADALDAGRGWGMVLQSTSWQSYAPPVCNADAAGCVARCQPFPACAPFPSEAEMQSMRDQVLALGAPKPRMILYYSYFDVLRAPNDGGVAAWSNLEKAIAAP